VKAIHGPKPYFNILNEGHHFLVIWGELKLVPSGPFGEVNDGFAAKSPCHGRASFPSSLLTGSRALSLGSTPGSPT
jgi:hypothetical protein